MVTAERGRASAGTGLCTSSETTTPSHQDSTPYSDHIHTSSDGRRAYSPGGANGHYGALFAPDNSATMRFNIIEPTGGDNGPHDGAATD